MNIEQAVGPEEADGAGRRRCYGRQRSVPEADAAADASDAPTSPAAPRAGPGSRIPARFPLRLTAATAVVGRKTLL